MSTKHLLDLELHVMHIFSVISLLSSVIGALNKWGISVAFFTQFATMIALFTIR